MDRDRFLARVRARGLTPRHENLPHPLPEIDGVPEVVYRRDLTDLSTAFIESASRAGAQVLRASDAVSIEGLLDEVLGAEDVRSAVLSHDPEVDGIDGLLADRGVRVVERPQDADLGVTGAAWGVAATGSVVVDASRAGGRVASLLPPVHLALVRADRILPTPGALYRALGPDIASQLVLVTGPSRSADIELTLTVGVHGPGRVWIGVLDL